MMEDDVVDSFFKGMKESDKRLSVPVFPTQTEPGRRKQLPVFLYAAATVAAVVLISVFLIYKNSYPVQQEQVFILMGEDTMNTNSLIEEKSLSEWESPTIFLAEDF